MRYFGVITVVISSRLLLEVTAQECTSDGSCDKHERCPVWASEGECLRSKAYMAEHCPASCKEQGNVGSNKQKRVLGPDDCDDLHERCSLWAAAGAYRFARRMTMSDDFLTNIAFLYFRRV